MDNDNISKKDGSKGKILLFIIGVLVGAIISTAAFFVYVKTLGANNSSNNSSSQQTQGGGTPPEMPSGENNQGGTPPEMPSDNSSNNN